jgi:hypothetical protein
MKKKSPLSKEEKFNSHLVEEYLKYGSVETAFRKNNYELPISYAQYQRILAKWGIIKNAGPNNKLTESLDFLSHLAKDNIAFEDLYRKMPPNFQTSAVTLYRILAYVKEGLTRRLATALILTPYDNEEKILIAKDVSTPRVELGKLYGSLSLPMGFSGKNDSRKNNIVRVLQQEVYADKVIKRVFPYEIIPQHQIPFMYLDIADVRVAVYHIQLTKELSTVRNFSSYKLRDFEFKSISEIINDPNLYRTGVLDAVTGYKRYLHLLNKNLSFNPFQHKSALNLDLIRVPLEEE